jgi:hypothetical protein
MSDLAWGFVLPQLRRCIMRRLFQNKRRFFPALSLSASLIYFFNFISINLNKFYPEQQTGHLINPRLMFYQAHRARDSVPLCLSSKIRAGFIRIRTMIRYFLMVMEVHNGNLWFNFYYPGAAG